MNDVNNINNSEQINYIDIENKKHILGNFIGKVNLYKIRLMKTRKEKNEISILKQISKKSATEAIEKAKKNGSNITYIKGNQIISERPDGVKVVIKNKEIITQNYKLKKGMILHDRN